MRPDDQGLFPDEGVDTFDLPIDADLAPLDAELEAAGALARRGLHGRVQPTRAYSIELRRRLLGAFPAPVAAMPDGAAGAVVAPGMPSPALIARRDAGETWTPIPLEPRRASRTPRWLLAFTRR